MAWYWPFNSNKSFVDKGPVQLRRLRSHVENKIRRLDVAQGTKDSDARWSRVDGRTINQILLADLKRVHERSAYEVRNNAIVSGTIETHARDVVGTNGPNIQVVGYNDRWNDRAEQLIREYCEAVTADGRCSMGDWLRDSIRDLWTIGDMLDQLVIDDAVEDSGMVTRVHPLDARGLPYTILGSVIFGIERNKFRRPLRYHVHEVQDRYTYWSQPKILPADDVMHDFLSIERGQIRGMPMLTPSLDAISELREYDGIVIKAAKIQALMSAFMQAVDAMGEGEEDPEPFEIVDGGITRVPAGYEIRYEQPTQPMQANTEFRSERMRELGSPVGMPLMKLQHDSSKHNYSSARFDAGSYQRACEVFQAWLMRRRVAPLLKIALMDAMYANRLEPRSLRNVRILGAWQKPPHADPVKEATAAMIRMESRQTSPLTEALASGADYDTICREWQRANEMHEKYGLPPVHPSSLQEYLMWQTGDIHIGSENGNDSKNGNGDSNGKSRLARYLW